VSRAGAGVPPPVPIPDARLRSSVRSLQTTKRGAADNAAPLSRPPEFLRPGLRCGDWGWQSRAGAGDCNGDGRTAIDEIVCGVAPVSRVNGARPLGSQKFTSSGASRQRKSNQSLSVTPTQYCIPCQCQVNRRRARGVRGRAAVGRGRRRQHHLRCLARRERICRCFARASPPPTGPRRWCVAPRVRGRRWVAASRSGLIRRK